MRIQLLVVALAAIVFSSFEKSMAAAIDIQEEAYGKMPDGRDVKIFTLKNSHGVRARVMEYGAILVSVETPDRTDKIADVTLGYDHFEDWLHNYYYFGATVGRYGNRIAAGKFSLDGKSYNLFNNNNPGGMESSLHGGKSGFSQKLWKGVKTADGVEFSYVSKDGEEGYPGTLSVKVSYTLNEKNELTWKAVATTDAPTVLNIINHAYWNLSGDPTTATGDNELTIHADQFLPTNKGLIPTGELSPVAGTPMDFTKPAVIGSRIDEDFPALKTGGGYDHAWVLRKGEGVRPAARLKDPKSGRVLEVSTDAPALQFYAAHIDGGVKGKAGIVYKGRAAVCLETEAFPDAPNQPAFPSTVLRPGETYQHTMVLKFSAE